MFNGIKKNIFDCIKLVKFLVDDYREYKYKEIQFQEKSQRIISQNMANLEEKIEQERLERERQLKENVRYDQNTNKYYFETTVEYKGVSRTFSCFGLTEDQCRTSACFVLFDADSYKKFGVY